MEKHRKKLMLLASLTALLALLVPTGCKKEYVGRVNKIPVLADNFIESFALSEFSPDTIIQTAIVDDEIIVYWPTYKPLPETISPRIETSRKATVSPASEAPVPFRNGEKYTVTSEVGGKKEYALRVDLRQPLPVIQMSSKEFCYQGTVMSIAGFWFLPDKEKTQVIFVDTTSKVEIPLDFYNFGTAPQGILLHHDRLPLGTYHIKAVNGIHTVFATNKIGEGKKSFYTINAYFPRTLSQVIRERSKASYTLRRGDEFTIGGSCLNHLDKVFLKEKKQQCGQICGGIHRQAFLRRMDRKNTCGHAPGRI